MADEISREALLIYLENIRTMETIIKHSEKKLPQIEEKKEAEQNKMCELENRKYSKIGNRPSEPEFHLSNDSKQFLVFALILIFIGIFLFIWDIMKFESVSLWFYNSFKSHFSHLSTVGFMSLIFSLIGLIYLIIFLVSFISARKKHNLDYERYPDELRAYEAKKRRYEEECNIQIAKVNAVNEEGDRHKSEIQSEIELIKHLLNQAYSANIIPSPFRNIQGVYFLYDYLSTSTHTLADALMQCNLDTIKQNFDEVINVNGATIIKQAQANAALFEQNQHILESAEATMKNTAVAAKYAQISAVNSQLSLKMQSSQLAYQKADFWLK